MLPEITAIKYLLITKFGIEYNEKKAEIELMTKRLEKGEEVWINEYRDEESISWYYVKKKDNLSVESQIFNDSLAVLLNSC